MNDKNNNSNQNASKPTNGAFSGNGQDISKEEFNREMQTNIENDRDFEKELEFEMANDDPSDDDELMKKFKEAIAKKETKD